jgi:hypothetical protein
MAARAKFESDTLAGAPSVLGRRRLDPFDRDARPRSAPVGTC